MKDEGKPNVEKRTKKIEARADSAIVVYGYDGRVRHPPWKLNVKRWIIQHWKFI
jgi:hypothetical protein